MENDIASLVLVGIGRHGSYYLESLLEAHASKTVKLSAVIEPNPRRRERFTDLSNAQIPVYKSLEDFYAAGGKCDVAVICSPIHYHAPQTCLALSRGSNVFCEKPAAATVQDVRRMTQARNRAAKWVAIGYQWSFTKAIQTLKRDIQKELFGKPKRLKCLVFWPREENYYRRSDWNGAQRDGEGRWILDSPVNNAAAHFLHNMFYVLGHELNSSAKPVRVRGELYRANDIGNYDTAALRCYTENNVEILFYTTHAVQTRVDPIFTFEFERARIEYGNEHEEITAYFRDGSTKRYGSPEAETIYTKPHQKILDVLHAAANGKEIACGIEAASAQTLCMNGLQESMPKIVELPPSLVKKVEMPRGEVWCVDGLEDVFIDCFKQAVLPSDAGVAWSRKGREIDLTEYHEFPRGS